MGRRARRPWQVPRRRWFGAFLLACLVVALPGLTPAARAAAALDLGPVPAECTAANYQFADCLVQTRLGTFSLSPHVVHAGGTITGTIAGDCRIGYDRPDDPCPIGWSGMPGAKVSGCGQFDHTCVHRIPAAALTASYTTAQVNITNGQGTGVSRDYYAVVGKGRLVLAGHVSGPRGEPLRGVGISIAGTSGTVRRRTDAAGSYDAVLARGRYVVSAGTSTVRPVPSADCVPSGRACRVALFRDRTADFAQSEPLSISGMMPPRLVDANQDGMLDYPTTIDPASFDVWIRVSRAGGGRCDTAATYAFVLDGHPASATPGTEPCVSVLKVGDQGRHTVAVTVTAADGTRSRGEGLVTVRDFLIAGLGDSVGSGEGNPDIPGYLGDGFRWQEPRCDRSAHSFEAQAAESIEQGSRLKASVTFLHLACSGAGLDIGVTGPYFGIAPGGQSLPLRSQISELDLSAGSRKVDAVIVSIGANDIGFGDIVSFCAVHSECDHRIFKDGRTLSAVTRSRISRLPELYATLARRLKAAGVPAARVFITQYYDPLHGADGRFCPSTVGLMGAREGAWAYNSVMRRLNVQVATAAQQWGWHLVSGAQQGFRTHGYCSASSWIVGLAASLDTQGNERGTMHPNVAGHTFIARRVLDVLRPELLPGGVPRAAG